MKIPRKYSQRYITFCQAHACTRTLYRVKIEDAVRDEKMICCHGIKPGKMASCSKPCNQLIHFDVI